MTRGEKPPWRRAVLASVALGLGLALFWGDVAGTARATTAQTLNTGQVTTLQAPGAKEMKPGDGRLAGYGFASDVTGVAFVHDAGGSSGQPVVAGPGDQLAVVSLAEHDVDQSAYYAYDTSTPPTYTLTAGKVTVSLPGPSGLESPLLATWAVSVPDGSPAMLNVSRSGFTQSFDLRTGRRVGSSPTALYRGALSPQVDVTLAASQTLTATGGPGGPVSVTVSPNQATLGYFKPGETIEPSPPPGKAWLMVGMGTSRASDSAGNPVYFSGFFAAPNVVLRTSAGTVDPVTLSFMSQGPFPDIYAFEVPANLTAATLVVALNGHIAATDGGSNLTLNFHDQTAELAIDLPPVPGPGPQGYIAAPQGGTRPHATSKPAEHTGGTGVPVGLLVAVVAVLLACVVVGVALLRRRRDVLPVVAVRHRPTALLAGVAVPLHPEGSQPLGLPVGGAFDADHDRGPGAVVSEREATATTTGPSSEDVGTTLVVSVLGPLQVEGLRAPVTRSAARRLLVALALCTDGPVSVERLRDLIAKDPDKPESAETVHSLASKLRSSLPKGALPPISAGTGGYRLAAEVEVDWAVFQDLAASATGAGGAGKVDLGLKALSLVRGVPLAHGSWEGVDGLVRPIETAIENLAVDTARAALEVRDARSAEAAIAGGLKAVAQSPVLWELRLVAAAAGSGFGLARAWNECQATLKEDASLLHPTYRKLRRGEF